MDGWNRPTSYAMKVPNQLCRWHGLKVLQCERGRPLDEPAYVQAVLLGRDLRIGAGDRVDPEMVAKREDPAEPGSNDIFEDTLTMPRNTLRPTVTGLTGRSSARSVLRLETT
jgi:hypothetical protein